MKPDIYRLIEQCVDTGSKLGVGRAFKHNDTPTQDQIAEKVSQAVMQELHEWFTFEGD